MQTFNPAVLVSFLLLLSSPLLRAQYQGRFRSDQYGQNYENTYWNAWDSRQSPQSYTYVPGGEANLIAGQAAMVPPYATLFMYMQFFNQWEQQNPVDDVLPPVIIVNPPPPPPNYRETVRNVLISREGANTGPSVVPEPKDLGALNGIRIRKTVRLQVGQSVMFSLRLDKRGSVSYHESWTNSYVASVAWKRKRYKPSDRCRKHPRMLYCVQAHETGRTKLILQAPSPIGDKGARRAPRCEITIICKNPYPDEGTGPYTAIENARTRSQVTYRVTRETQHVIARLRGKVVRLRGIFRVDPRSGYSGYCDAISVEGIIRDGGSVYDNRGPDQGLGLLGQDDYWNKY